MHSPFAKSRANNLPTDLIDDDLRFQGVTLFLAAVVTTLFFWGCSMGLSVTSTLTD